MMSHFKVGLGIDYHCLVEGRPLILGGVNVPHDRGLEGHSDADVVLHAISDAMLGALGLGDIGHYFPNTDERWKNVSSLLILERVNDLLKEKQYVVGNLDVMLSMEQPKIAPYISDMRTQISRTLSIDISCVSIKATTAEGLGFVGREEGVAAHAIVLVHRL